jgi:TIGR03009 family protein
MAIAQNGNQGNAAQRQTGRTTAPQLTAEQQSAMQRAASETPAQRNKAQQTLDIAQNPLSLVSSGTQQQNITQPEGFPLEPAHDKYVNELLEYWQQNSQRVEKYKCGFKRFEYDPVIVGWRDPSSKRLAAHTIKWGEIRFAAPDRARYETTKIVKFKKPPEQPGGDADYEESDEEGTQERWVCDGKSIFDFDFENKRLYETELPKEMQGNIAESPLPFIFGANKDQITQRYWVRSVTPDGVQDEYWLEMYPKRIQDARAYSKLEVIIARDDFLPKAMHLYSPQYDPAKGNEASQYFMFENREVNSQLAKFQDFFGAFVRPRVPFGWKRVNTQVEMRRQAESPKTQLPAEQTPPTRR